MYALHPPSLPVRAYITPSPYGNYLLRFSHEGEKSGTRTRETHVVRYAHDTHDTCYTRARARARRFLISSFIAETSDHGGDAGSGDADDARALIEILKANVMLITMTIQFRRWNAINRSLAHSHIARR